MPGTRLTLSDRAKIVELHLQGFSNGAIERLTGKTKRSILTTMRMYTKGMIDLKAAREYEYKATKSRFEKLELESSAATPLAVQVEENNPKIAKLDREIAKAKQKVQEMEEANRQGKGKLNGLNQAENYYRSLKSERRYLLTKQHE